MYSDHKALILEGGGLRGVVSLPFLAKPVNYDGRIMMDGGLSDQIPIRKSIDDGNDKNILVLTRPKGYRKKPSRLMRFANLRYPRYKGLCKTLVSQYARYNEKMDFIDQLEQRGDVFVVRPIAELYVGRIERNTEKLYSAYDQGYRDASTCYVFMIQRIRKKSLEIG